MAKKKPAKSHAAKAKSADFESALASVEEIVRALEGGELDLTDALQQYEEGVKQLKTCHAILNQAERRVTLLSGFDADGNPVTEPMPEAEPDLSGGAGASGAARASGQESSMDDSPGLF